MKQDIAKKIAQRIGAHNIVLFLGAGVNEGNIPRWRELLNRVIKHAIHYSLGDKWSREKRDCCVKWLTPSEDEDKADKGKESPPPPSFYERASLAKRLLGRHYLHVVRQKLFEGIPKSLPSIVPTEEGKAKLSYLRSITQLCGIDQVKAVISYNYDDNLERLMNKKEKGRRAISLCSQRLPNTEYSALPVYHVHGFLPYEGSLSECDEPTFVFSYEEYFQTFLEPFNWQTSHQLYFLRSCVCLFLGVSLNDLNMLRMLSHAHKYAATPGVFVLWCDRDMVLPEEKLLAECMVDVRRALCADLGVELIQCGEEYIDVYNVVDELYRELVGTRRQKQV